MDQMMIHLMSLTTIRTSNDIEVVREFGTTYAKKFYELNMVVRQAYEKMLSEASPEELPVIEKFMKSVEELSVAAVEGGLDEDA